MKCLILMLHYCFYLQCIYVENIRALTEKNSSTFDINLSENMAEFLCKHIHGIPKENCSCRLFIYEAKNGESTTLCDKKHITPKFESYEDPNLAMSRIVYASLVMFASTLGVFGNLLVIIVKPRRKMSRHSLLITVLAMCDFSFAIVSILRIVPFFWTLDWLYNATTCRFLISFLAAGAWVTVFIVLIIVIERYKGIVHPLGSGLTTKNVYIMLIMSAITTFLAVIPIYMHLDTADRGISNNPNEEHLQCREQWNSAFGDALYSWAILLVYFIFPLVVISVLYSKIFQKLTRNSLLTGTSISDERFALRRLERNRKTMIILLVVLSVFVICTLPNKLRHVIVPTSRYSIEFDWLAFIVTDTFYSFHVAANPVIYCFIDKQFRKQILEHFCLRKRKPNDQRATMTLRFLTSVSQSTMRIF